MEWFKQYTSDGTDPRLEILTDAQHRTWFRLECLAAKTGGVIPPKPTKLLALEVAGRDEALLTSTLAELVELELVSVEADGAIAFVDARRFQRKPSDEPEATRARTAKSREAKKQAELVTPRHALVTRDISSHALEREKEEREETEGGDRAEAREATPAPLDADAEEDLAPPVPGKPIAAGHPFTTAQLERIKAAFPPGQFWEPSQMHYKVRQELGAYVDKYELEPAVISAWTDLETETKVVWFAEAMRRSVVENKKPAWRLAFAAKQIGRALQNGLDLMADGWAPREKGQRGKIAQFPGQPGRHSEPQGLAVPDDAGKAIAAKAKVGEVLATVDGKRRADLEACSGVRRLVSKGTLPAVALEKALANRGLTVAELDAYDGEQKGPEVAHG